MIPQGAAYGNESSAPGLNEASRIVAAAAKRATEPASQPSPALHGRNYAWAELMARVYSFDVLACQHCGGKLRNLAAIQTPETIRKILDWLRLPSKPPPLAPPAVDLEFEFAPEWF